ncbi:MAG: U32 family peptidase [Clostridiales bacterium]|jgi:putative protease|nr:U32 family peptidase [Clostridiales bacterium]
MEIELLCPAGSAEAARAAVSGGASAVYIGGADFSARHYAENAREAELSEVIDYCHLRGVSVYITLNTVYLDEEFPELLRFAAEVYKAGADAFIICDMGLFRALRAAGFALPLHGSTQLCTHSIGGALYLRELGFARVNLSRELSLQEIAEISSRVPAEGFAHGALCASYSGRCLMSAFFGAGRRGFGERSGNRGRCAQPCRLPYKLYDGKNLVREGRLLSPKDLCALPLLPELAASGLLSLKIEGRMKSPEYCAAAAREYSEALSDIENGAEPDKEREARLLGAFNRKAGFTPGYFERRRGREMMTESGGGPAAGTLEFYDGKTGACGIRASERLIPGDGLGIPLNRGEPAGCGVNRETEPGGLFRANIGKGLERDIRVGAAVYKSFDKAAIERARRVMAENRRMPARARVRAKIGRPVSMEIYKENVKFQAEGPFPQKAEKSAVSPEEIIKRLGRTGGTPLKLEFTDADVEEGLFIPAGELNALRRAAAGGFCREWAASFKREAPGITAAPPENDGPPEKPAEPRKTALAANFAQFQTLADFSPHLIYLEADVFLKHGREARKMADSRDFLLFAALPRLDFADPAPLISRLASLGADGFLARTNGQLRALTLGAHSAEKTLCKEAAFLAGQLGHPASKQSLREGSSAKKTLCLDYSFNVFNSRAVAFYRESLPNLKSAALSVELSGLPREIGSLSGLCEVVVYGHIPLMLTRQCPVGNFAGEEARAACGKPGDFRLIDRKGSELRVKRDCENCAAAIYSGGPVSLPKIPARAGFVRLEFSFETAGETARAAEKYWK